MMYIDAKDGIIFYQPIEVRYHGYHLDIFGWLTI